MRILGLDVSASSTGWAVLNNSKLLKNSFGVIECGKLSIPDCIYCFGSSLEKIINKHKLDAIVIEDTFLRFNVKTLKLLCYLAGVAVYLSKDKKVFLMTVKEVRKILEVTDKKGVFDFVVDKYKLNLNFIKDNDITDAIAVALAYSIKLKQVAV